MTAFNASMTVFSSAIFSGDMVDTEEPDMVGGTLGVVNSEPLGSIVDWEELGMNLVDPEVIVDTLGVVESEALVDSEVPGTGAVDKEALGSIDVVGGGKESE